MRDIVKNWIEFCESGLVARRGQYNSIFMDNATEDEVETIFKPFINREELYNRMIKYLKDYRNNGIKDVIENKKSYMEHLLRLDFEERKPDVENSNLFKNLILPTKFQFNPDYEEVEDDIMSDIFSQRFSDFFIRNKINEENKIYALYRAVDSISIHYSFTQYLFQPLVNINYTANHIYEFLMRGGTYAVIEDTVYYSFKEELS